MALIPLPFENEFQNKQNGKDNTDDADHQADAF
jgi:hypothetical protein